MPDFEADDLRITESSSAPGLIRLDWMGKSNARDPQKLLSPFFERVLNRAVLESRLVELHFEKLEYFNSSTMAALIQLINAAQEKKIRLDLVYDQKLRWQTLSFDALKRAIRPFESGQGTPVSIKSV
ncbi:MAG: hypothetical protein ACJ790_04490 [Myxococcaceae bacterium]